MTDRKGLADRLEAIAFDDHERGCEGLNYLCSCGFDDREHDALKEAAAALRQEPSVEVLQDIIQRWINVARDQPTTSGRGEARQAAQAIAALYRGET